MLNFKNDEAGVVKKFTESLKTSNKKYLMIFNLILLFQNIVQLLMYTINQDSVSKDPYDDTHFIVGRRFLF